MAISKVQVVSIPVSDQDRAKDFYAMVLGFELIQDITMDATMRWVSSDRLVRTRH